MYGTCSFASKMEHIAFHSLLGRESLLLRQNHPSSERGNHVA